MQIHELGELLTRPSIDPRFCNRLRTDFHLVIITEKTAGDWLSAFVDDSIPNSHWRWCTRDLLSTLPHSEAIHLLDAMGVAYRNLIKDARFEHIESLQEKVSLLHQLFLERKGELDPHKELEDKLVRDLRSAVNSLRLGRIATAKAKDLLHEYDLRRMIWQGQIISIDTIDKLARDKNEPELARISRRIPEPVLRGEAKSRLIRLRMERLPYPELSNITRSVEEHVLKHGTFSLPLDNYPIINAWFEPNFLATHGVLIDQSPNDDLWKTSLRLFIDRRGKRHVEPRIALTGALQIAVQGFARPVTLCPSVEVPDVLDPTPCVSPKDVVIEYPLATLNPDGTLSLVDDLSDIHFRQLVNSQDGFVLPIRIGEKHLLHLSLKLYIKPPPKSVFTAVRLGLNGPRLWVLIDHRDPSRFLITVLSRARQSRIVLDLSDAPEFQIISQGADGVPGIPGFHASPCQGGGDGGSGGNGGRINVRVACADASCFHTIFLAQNMIRSIGGSGGPGGEGSPCGDDYGSFGPKGKDGSSGLPGPIKFDVVAPGKDLTFAD